MSDATDFLNTTPGVVPPEFNPEPTSINTPVIGDIVGSSADVFREDGHIFFSLVECDGRYLDYKLYPELAQELNAQLNRDELNPSHRQAYLSIGTTVGFNVWFNPTYTGIEWYTPRNIETYLAGSPDFVVASTLHETYPEQSVTGLTIDDLDTHPLYLACHFANWHGSEAGTAYIRFKTSAGAVPLTIRLDRGGVLRGRMSYSFDGVVFTDMSTTSQTGECGAGFRYLPNRTGMQVTSNTHVDPQDILVDLTDVVDLTFEAVVAFYGSGGNPDSYSVFAIEKLGRTLQVPTLPPLAAGMPLQLVGDKQ